MKRPRAPIRHKMSATRKSSAAELCMECFILGGGGVSVKGSWSRFKRLLAYEVVERGSMHAAQLFSQAAGS